MARKDSAPWAVLGEALDLPCGVRLKNRLIKAAMSDSLGDGEGNATEAQITLYERWAEGGAALALVGEVQTSPRYPEKPGNLVLHPHANLNALKDLAARGSAHGAHLWPQLGHAGALSYAPISEPKGPSALQLDGLRCDEMPVAEIEALPGIYARAATLAKEAGFSGVQIHAAHGFLFSQFLSPLFNRRSDAYGGQLANRFRIIGETIDAVRRSVGAAYPIGVKINASDGLAGGLSEDEALEVVRCLDQTSADLIEASGGTYFPGAPSSSEGRSTSGPYYLEFARRAKAITSIPIAPTGGFKTRKQAVEAIGGGAADAVGLARAMVLDPSLANAWLSEKGGDPKFPVFDAPPEGAVTAWYTMRLTALGLGTEDEFDETAASAMIAYERRDAERCQRWRERFG